MVRPETVRLAYWPDAWKPLMDSAFMPATDALPASVGVPVPPEPPDHESTPAVKSESYLLTPTCAAPVTARVTVPSPLSVAAIARAITAPRNDGSEGQR